jgi:hypothetical protein
MNFNHSNHSNQLISRLFEIQGQIAAMSDEVNSLISLTASLQTTTPPSMGDPDYLAIEDPFNRSLIWSIHGVGSVKAIEVTDGGRLLLCLESEIQKSTFAVFAMGGFIRWDLIEAALEAGFRKRVTGQTWDQLSIHGVPGGITFTITTNEGYSLSLPACCRGGDDFRLQVAEITRLEPRVQEFKLPFPPKPI